jgi:hypothetical protein
MRATRRRKRKPDQLASPEAVRQILEQLRELLPFSIPNSEKELIRFLYSIGHVERNPASDTRRGRPGRWDRKKLTEAASTLRIILDRETQGRVSVKSFVSQYLQVLHLSNDIVNSLRAGQINLQESIHLGRLSAARLGCSSKDAAKLRRGILDAHLAVQGSQTRLRAKVKEILGESGEPKITTEAMTQAVQVIDELLEVDPADSRHLFWEQMKEIFFAIRDIEIEDLDNEILEEFTTAIDQISSVLYKIRKRKKDREQHFIKDILSL